MSNLPIGRAFPSPYRRAIALMTREPPRTDEEAAPLRTAHRGKQTKTSLTCRFPHLKIKKKPTEVAGFFSTNAGREREQCPQLHAEDPT